ncbi:MAG: beta-propeller fold lactonase family protein [Planctomycetota bacterium]
MTPACLPGLLLLALPTPQTQLPPPVLSAPSGAVIGEAVEFSLGGTVQLPPIQELLLLDLELLPAPVPFGPYGDLYLAASPALDLLPGDGSSSWTFEVPNEPALVGLELHAQALGFVYVGFAGALLLSNPVSVVFEDAPPPSARLAVVANRGDGSLTLHAVDLQGAGTRHFGVEVPGGELRAVAASPDGRFLFAADATSDVLHRVEVDPATGERTALGTTLTGARPLDVEVDPSGRFVYTANLLGNSISQFALDPLGNLSPLSPPAISTALAPTDLTIDPEGRWLFAIAAGSGLLAVHAIDPGTGALSLSSVFPLEGAVSRVLVGDEGEWIHLLSGGTQTLTTWTFDTAVGQVIAPLGAAVAVPPGTIDAALHPDGDAIYLLDSAGSVLVHHDVDPTTGEVSVAPASITPTANGAAAVRIDPRGERLYVCGIAENELWIHAPQLTTGEPQFVQRIRQRSLPLDVAVVTGEEPTAIQSRLFLAGHAASNEVRTFQLDLDQGQLIDLGAGASTSGPGASGLSLDPSTGLLASADSSAAVSTFRFNVENANLASTGPVALSSDPIDVVIEASGRFGWSSEPALDQLRHFAYVSGVPTDLGAIALGGGADPGPVATTPAGDWLFVGARGTGRVLTFRVAGDGALSQTGSASAQGTPSDLLVTPNGRHLLTAASGPGRVTSYAIDPQLGAPTAVTILPVGPDPVGLAVTHSGRFAYVADATEKTIRVMALDPDTGVLTGIQAAGLAEAPSGVAVDAAGRVAVAVVPSLDLFQIFTIDPDDGTLSPLGLSLSGGDSPTTLAASIELD